jgi:hypothetical protein
MPHYKIVPADQWDRLTTRQARHKHLADPVTDVICVVVLTVVLLLAGYMHLSMGL